MAPSAKSHSSSISAGGHRRRVQMDTDRNVQSITLFGSTTLPKKPFAIVMSYETNVFLQPVFRLLWARRIAS